MFTNLDAQFLANLADAYVEAEVNGTGLPVIDNATAARLRAIAENLQGLDERSGIDQYDLGFAAGVAHQRSRSNILDVPEEPKAKQRERLAKATRGKRPSNIPPFEDINLADLGL